VIQRYTGAQTMPMLEALRRRKPLTQRELAQEAGVSEATIRAIENGQHIGRVRPRTMRAIAQVLQVQPVEIDEFRPSLGVSDEESEEKRAA